MSFFATIGYKFPLPGNATADGGVVLASAMTSHQLLRRRFDKYSHLQRRIFDPQLYLSGLDAGAAPKQCAKLASYPWFGVPGVPAYSSSQQDLKGWQAAMEKRIASVWPGVLLADPAKIRDAVAECVDMQVRLGCEAIVLPSPLTSDPASDYSEELTWLDAGLAAAQGETRKLPVYASVAISDICLAYMEPTRNSLLDAIIDSVSARGVDGVYLVIEQANEPADGRMCANSRTLRSALELVHTFARDGGLAVGVNFMGPFGLACFAAGASWWATAWYKSLIRLRVADPPGGGRAYPTYWSAPTGLEINLESDFDHLVGAGLLQAFADRSDAADGLLRAAEEGVSVRNVPDWLYRPSNVTSARAHYFESQAATHSRLAALPPENRLASVAGWLADANDVVEQIGSVLSTGSKTKLGHAASWLRAVQDYKRDHDL